MRIFVLLCGAAIAVAAVFPSISRADLLNGSFEAFPISGAPNGFFANGAPDFYTLRRQSPALTGWTVTGQSIDVMPDGDWVSQTGAANSFSVDLVGSPAKAGDATPQTGGITQTVMGLTAGHQYAFSYWYSVDPESNSYNDQLKNKILSVSITDGEDGILYSPANLVLMAGTRKVTDMQWENVTAEITATTSEMVISFAAVPNSLTTPALNDVLAGPVIDSVSLTDLTTGAVQSITTPEPASLAVLGMAGVVLLARRKRAF